MHYTQKYATEKAVVVFQQNINIFTDYAEGNISEELEKRFIAALFAYFDSVGMVNIYGKQLND